MFIFGQYLSPRHYPPIYQPLEGVYVLNWSNAGYFSRHAPRIPYRPYTPAPLYPRSPLPPVSSRPSCLRPFLHPIEAAPTWDYSKGNQNSIKTWTVSRLLLYAAESDKSYFDVYDWFKINDVKHGTDQSARPSLECNHWVKSESICFLHRNSVQQYLVLSSVESKELKIAIAS